MRLAIGVEENLMLDSLAMYLGGSEDSETKRIIYTDIADGQSEMMDGWHDAMDTLAEAVQVAGLELGGEQLALMSSEFAKLHGVVGQLAQMLNQEH